MRAQFVRRYGAGPLHLAGHLLGFAVVAFALDQIFSGGHVVELLEWFVGFALLHDLVLLPLYSGIDRVGRRLMPTGNYLRVPAMISGLLLLIYLPLISGVGASTYFFYSGHHPRGYLRNWVLITAGLFVASGLIWTWRRVRLGR